MDMELASILHANPRRYLGSLGFFSSNVPTMVRTFSLYPLLNLELVILYMVWIWDLYIFILHPRVDD